MDFKGSLGYLIHELAQAITAESDQILTERFDIGFSQYKVMLVLCEKEGIQQKYIAMELSQTEASISRQIGVLIDKDLVEIGASEDNRQHPIYLTPEGKELMQRASNYLNNSISLYFDNLNDIQLSRLRETLQLIRRRIAP